MNTNLNKKIINELNTVFNELCIIDSLILMIRENCLNKEISSKYYNLSIKKRLELSCERNQYINILSLAHDKLINIKELHNTIEQNLIYSYNKTPTIAADK